MPLSSRPTIESDAIYYVQNTHDGYTTYNHGPLSSGEQFKWGGKNSPDADDVQAIPGYVVRSPQFQAVLNKGLFVLVEDNATEMAGEIWRQRAEEEKVEVLSSLDNADDEVLEQFTCPGPGKKGTNSPCGEQVFLRRKDSEEKPPLCSRHASYAKYFTKGEDGWERISPK